MLIQQKVTAEMQRQNSPISLLAFSGLQCSGATGASIQDLGIEHGPRTLVITCNGGKVVTSRSPRAARAIDLAIGERSEGPDSLYPAGRRLAMMNLVPAVVVPAACGACWWIGDKAACLLAAGRLRQPVLPGWTGGVHRHHGLQVTGPPLRRIYRCPAARRRGWAELGVCATGQIQDLVLRLPRETRPGLSRRGHGELTRPADHAVVMSARIEE